MQTENPRLALHPNPHPQLSKPHLTHTPTPTTPNSSASMIDETDRQFTLGFDAATQLYKKGKFDQCVEALRDLLAKPATPRFCCIKRLSLLGGTLGDWEEAYSCYV
jgi:hypothetical protein